MADPTAPDSTVSSLMPWDQALRRADARSRVLDVLDRPDAAEAVAALAPLEAYQAVKSLGPADAAPVLALLTEDQTRALLDLDLWHRHELEVADLLIWFEAFRVTGVENLVKAARALDGEALALVLRRRLLVTLKPKDDASDPDPVPAWASNPPEALGALVETPDGRFIVAARVFDEEDDEERHELDEEERKGILQLVAELYRDEDWEHAAGILRSAMSDLSSALHEDALRFRDARLEDLGFPPLQRALEVYGPLEPSALTETPPAPYPALDSGLPAVYAHALSDGLFHAAMQGLEDPELVRRIEGDLVPLANRALVADGAEPGMIEHLQDTLTRMRGYIELALAHGTPPGAARLETAVARLTTNHVGVLFRVGYTLTLKAATRARALAGRTGLEQDGLPLMAIDGAERVALDALRAKRPRVAEALAPRIEAAQAGGDPAAVALGEDLEAMRAFRAPEDLDAVDGLLEELEALAEALEGVVGAPETPTQLPIEEQTADVRLATALAHARLGAAPRREPLAVDEVRRLVTALGEGEGADAAAVAAVAEWLGAPALLGRLTRILGGLRGELGALAPDDVDPRFLAGLLVRAG